MTLRSQTRALGTVALTAVAIVLALATAYVLVRRQLIGEVDKLAACACDGDRHDRSRGCRDDHRPDSRRWPRFRVPPAPFRRAGGLHPVREPHGDGAPDPGRAHQAARRTEPSPSPPDGARASSPTAPSPASSLRIYTARAGNGAVQIARAMGDVDSALGWIRVVFGRHFARSRSRPPACSRSSLPEQRCDRSRTLTATWSG